MGETTLAGRGRLCCCLCWEWWRKGAPSVFIHAPMTIPAHPIPRWNSKRTGCQRMSMCIPISMKVGTWRVTSCHVPLSDAYDTHRADYSPTYVLWLHPDKHQTNLQANWRFSRKDIPCQKSTRHQRGIRASRQTAARRIDTRTAETLLRCRRARQTAAASAERHRSVPRFHQPLDSLRHTLILQISHLDRGKSIRCFFPEDDLTATSSNKKPEIMQSYLQIVSLSSLTFKVMNVKYALFLIPLLSTLSH